MITITEEELYKLVRRANGLVGRQAITGYYSDGYDKWVFDSNAKGGYGETLTFHYRTDEDLLKDIAPGRTAIIRAVSDGGEVSYILH